MMDPLTIIHGNCVEVMRGMAEASIDAIVTDPPYGLEFMGKDWDGLKGFRRSANEADVGRDNVFGRTSRTSPEYVTGAGFSKPGIGDRQTKWPSFAGTNESRCDTCGHLTHGGSPCQCASPKFRSLRPERMVAFQTWTEAWAIEAIRVLKPGGYLLSFGGTRTYHRMTCAIEDAGFEIRDCIAWLYGSGFPKSLDVSKAMDKAAGVNRQRHRGVRSGVVGSTYAQDEWSLANKDSVLDSKPITDLAKQWQGWGTALKPAFEPIVVARKPLISTVVANVERYGTGALNIDGTRIGNEPRVNQPMGAPENAYGGYGASASASAVSGRWPANVTLDENAAVMLDAQSGERPSGVAVQRNGGGGGYFTGIGDGIIPGRPMPDGGYSDYGGASRFFYTAKASRSDRGVGNSHPTVKPVELMRWLVRLVTPRGGLILDPFAGSGTTGQAALAEGFRCILIEREAEYVAGIKTWRANMQLGHGAFAE